MNTGVEPLEGIPITAAKLSTSSVNLDRRARAPVVRPENAKVHCEYQDLKQDQMAAVTEAPGQGDECAVRGQTRRGDAGT